MDYLDQSTTPRSGESGKPAGRSKIDYREVLTSGQFSLFSRLRDLRKQIAQTDAVPVYTVFTNEQLAEMVRTQSATKADLERIAGVGDARVTKYGERFLELLTSDKTKTDETRESPV